MKKIAAEVHYSVSTVVRTVRRAETEGMEVKRRPNGRPTVDRDLVLDRLKTGLDTCRTVGQAVVYARSMANCSETTVWRAKRGD